MLGKNLCFRIGFALFLPYLAFAMLGCSGGHSEHGIGPLGRTKPSKIFHDSNVAALADAAGKGDVAEIDRLVAAGVDVNAAGEDGVTPLFWALAAKNHDGFLRLLEHGADPNRKRSAANRFGSVIGEAASSKTDSFYLAAVLKHGGNPSLIEPSGNKANPQEQTTPLARAALYSRRTENLDLLIRAGADLNYKPESVTIADDSWGFKVEGLFSIG